MKKKIIIVGAGIAGLTAGCYGEMNGYDTRVFEMHDIPGGLCTSWDRKGYRIDGCIHWLMGVTPDSMFHAIWEELGILKGREFFYYDYIMQIENSSGEKLILYCDMDRLEAHLTEISPEDADVIGELTDAVRRFKDIRSATKDISLLKYYKVTVDDFTRRFKNSFIREALIAFSSKECTVFSLIFQLAIYNNKDACWPVGGSLEFAKGIEKRYNQLGGKVFYKSRVSEILVTDNRAVGVRLADGTEYTADYVISAADGYTTVFGMLGGRYTDGEIEALYAGKKVTGSSVQVSLGVDCDLSDYPYCTNLILDDTAKICGIEGSQILIKHYCYDKTLCKPGKSVITSLIHTDYGYWERLYDDKKAYIDEKQRIADWFIHIFENNFPKAKGKTEVVDVATPMTYHRYTNVWLGAYSGWKSPEQEIPNALPGLSGLFLAGQWTKATGGIPTAAITGKGSIMRLCKEDGKEFRV